MTAVETLISTSSVELNAVDDTGENSKQSLESLLQENDRYRLPKCILPPPSEYSPIEAFVEKAVREQHEQHANDLVPTRSYKGILDAIRTKSDPDMLRCVLVALRASGNGATLHNFTSSTTQHARLIHQIVRLDVVLDDLHLLDAHFHLLLAMTSANTVFLVNVATALWKLLTSHYQDMSTERYV